MRDSARDALSKALGWMLVVVPLALILAVLVAIEVFRFGLLVGLGFVVVLFAIGAFGVWRVLHR